MFGSNATFKLDELARAAGVSPRTVRYYVQRGLLPSPEFRGRDTAYTADHLLRLRAIRRLQERYWPLDRIQATLSRLDRDAIGRIAEGEEPALGDGEARGEAPEISAAIPLPPVGERATRWERYELAPGLELHLAEDAGPEARALAAELLALGWRRTGR